MSHPINSKDLLPRDTIVRIEYVIFMLLVNIELSFFGFDFIPGANLFLKSQSESDLSVI